MKKNKSIVLKKAWELIKKFCLSVKDAMLKEREKQNAMWCQEKNPETELCQKQEKHLK
jgi:hypothetical protein